MNALVVYDSAYGNTRHIVAAIVQSLQAKIDVRVIPAEDVMPDDLKDVDLAYVGSPTQGGRPTHAVEEFLHLVSPGNLRNLSLATFDTRLEVAKQSRPLKFLMKTIGFAAPKIAKAFEKKGGHLVAPPEGFIVEDREGPLAKGEVERASEWAQQVLQEAEKETVAKE